LQRIATSRRECLGLRRRYETHGLPGLHTVGLRARTNVGISSEFRKCGFKLSNPVMQDAFAAVSPVALARRNEGFGILAA
jgi:hypothetical protein